VKEKPSGSHVLLIAFLLIVCNIFVFGQVVTFE
jgi:hypothetical protein